MELEPVEGLLGCTDYWIMLYSLFYCVLPCTVVYNIILGGQVCLDTRAAFCVAVCVFVRQFVWPWAVSVELSVFKAAKPLDRFPSGVSFVLEFI